MKFFSLLLALPALVVGAPVRPPALVDIINVAVLNPELGTLVNVLTLPEYEPILTVLFGSGPFTLFAPTNDAFSAAGVDVKDVEGVMEVLKYHVLPGTMSSSDFGASQTATTVEGSKVVVRKTYNGVSVNDAAVVFPYDVPATNGGKIFCSVVFNFFLLPSFLFVSCFCQVMSVVGVVGAYVFTIHLLPHIQYAYIHTYIYIYSQTKPHSQNKDTNPNTKHHISIIHTHTHTHTYIYICIYTLYMHTSKLTFHVFRHIHHSHVHTHTHIYIYIHYICTRPN